MGSILRLLSCLESHVPSAAQWVPVCAVGVSFSELSRVFLARVSQVSTTFVLHLWPALVTDKDSRPQTRALRLPPFWILSTLKLTWDSLAADKEENVLDLLSHFIFLKETPKAFWGKPKAPGSVSASVGTRLLMFVGSGFAYLCKDQVNLVLKSRSVPYSSAVLPSGTLGFSWHQPSNAVERMPGNFQPPKYFTLVHCVDGNSIFFVTRNHHVQNIILARRCVFYMKFLILAS